MALTSTLTAIGDAIRACDGTTEPMTLDVMPERIKALSNQQSGEWKRPAGWPDLDAAFEAEGTGDVALWTVANALGGVVRFEVTRDSGEWTLERGSVVDGAFVASETVYSGTADFVQVDVSGTGYTVYRAKPTTEGSMFTMARINASNADCTTACPDMAVVEVAERVSMLQASPNGGSYMYNWGSNHTERIRIELAYKGSGTKTISFATCFWSLSGLRSLDMSNWDTTGWNVTNLNSMFSCCTSLESVNMSNWDTSGWNVTTLGSMFYGCYCLTDFAPPTAWPALATSLSQSMLLARESACALIDALPTTTSSLTLTLHAYAKARLTDDDIAAATAKGWKIA